MRTVEADAELLRAAGEAGRPAAERRPFGGAGGRRAPLLTPPVARIAASRRRGRGGDRRCWRWSFRGGGPGKSHARSRQQVTGPAPDRRAPGRTLRLSGAHAPTRSQPACRFPPSNHVDQSCGCSEARPLRLPAGALRGPDRIGRGHARRHPGAAIEVLVTVEPAQRLECTRRPRRSSSTGLKREA